MIHAFRVPRKGDRKVAFFRLAGANVANRLQRESPD